jgi:hypothetical protein
MGKLVNFKKYGPNRFDPDKFFGLVFHLHPKYKGVEIFIGRNVYEIWVGYRR